MLYRDLVELLPPSEYSTGLFSTSAVDRAAVKTEVGPHVTEIRSRALTSVWKYSPRRAKL